MHFDRQEAQGACGFEADSSDPEGAILHDGKGYGSAESYPHIKTEEMETQATDLIREGAYHKPVPAIAFDKWPMRENDFGPTDPESKQASGHS